MTDTTSTSAIFDGQVGHTYSFYSIAISNVGIMQAFPAAAQASTLVVSAVTAPSSSVNPLPALAGSPSFTLSWSGSPGAGASSISSYEVFASDDGGPFTPFLTSTTRTSATFTGSYGHTYAFFSVATNNLGTLQPVPAQAQATTTVAPLVTVTGVSTVTKKKLVDQVTIRFSGALNSGAAGSVGTYRLATAGKKGSFTAKNATVIKLKSAVYSSQNDTVTLTLKSPLKLTKTVQLEVNGEPPSGLEDSFGRLIDGDDNGQPGGNEIALSAKAAAQPSKPSANARASR